MVRETVDARGYPRSGGHSRLKELSARGSKMVVIEDHQSLFGRGHVAIESPPVLGPSPAYQCRTRASKLAVCGSGLLPLAASEELR